MNTEATETRPSIITRLATGAARRWQITLAFFLVVVLAGGYSYGFGLDREGFPPINTPISVVTGTYFVDDIDQVDADVVQPLAEAFADVADVASIESQARDSSFVVVVEFEDSIGSDEGTQRLLDLGVEFPSAVTDALTIDYRPVNAAKFVEAYDVLVSVVGPADATAADLQEQAAVLAEALQSESDVEAADVRDLITSSLDPATGDVEERLTRFTRVVIDDSGYQEAISIGLVREATSELDVLEFSDLIEDRLSEENAPLADGYRAEITADFAVGVGRQISSLTTNLLTGLIAVAIVSFLLIGWRVAVMTAGFMGLVMVGALVGLWAIGFTLNTITLFGLILTLGLLVDDAIVISESLDANRDNPDTSVIDVDDPDADTSVGVIKRAIDRVGSASFAGTLTTVVVFSPMLFIGGILGEFIRPIPTTVMITLLLSFLFSIVFIPTVARGFLLRGKGEPNPIVRAEQALARKVGRLAGYPSGNGVKGVLVGTGFALLAVVAIGAGVVTAGGLGFSIFPAGKDATGMSAVVEFPPGTDIEQAQAKATEIDDIIIDVLGDELDRSQYVRGNERTVDTFIDLTPIDSRSTTAPEFVEQIEQRMVEIEGARVTVGITENGPPVVEFPFAAQITVDDDTVDAGQALAESIREDLIGREITTGGSTVTITNSIVETDGEVYRVDGQRVLEVRAQYDEDSGISGILNETETYVAEAFDDAALEAAGLPAGALTFDFGFESDNQEDFAALGAAGLIALVLMLLLITIQFRSLAQSLLIFLAVPFSFFGVFTALSATDNPLSFLAVVGFIALIGVAVNNTILLVDAANQERRDGATASEAIQSAVTSRFRPLVATTITTVVGLLPLSLSDPFWESLGFTLMGGLISSTFLVVLSFPAFYLALEAVRTPARNAVRRRRGRPEIA
ncbi:MAG: efflux RND transporter permease subunit [Ilumatobacter sp.]|uniref:efflux RND transporter permease subunit n=1 Tax=Ilumatobacter sp. TaxID=1967498 RepID=UPI003C747EEF